MAGRGGPGVGGLRKGAPQPGTRLEAEQAGAISAVIQRWSNPGAARAPQSARCEGPNGTELMARGRTQGSVSAGRGNYGTRQLAGAKSRKNGRPEGRRTPKNGAGRHRGTEQTNPPPSGRGGRGGGPPAGRAKGEKVRAGTRDRARLPEARPELRAGAGRRWGRRGGRHWRGSTVGAGRRSRAGPRLRGAGPPGSPQQGRPIECPGGWGRGRAARRRSCAGMKARAQNRGEGSVRVRRRRRRGRCRARRGPSRDGPAGSPCVEACATAPGSGVEADG